MGATQAGVFNVLGFNFFTPVTWALLHMLFLYFLPEQPFFLVVYVVAFTMLSEAFGLVLRNLGLFTATPLYFAVVFPLVFGAWYTVAAWFFRAQEKARGRLPARPEDGV